MKVKALAFCFRISINFATFAIGILLCSSLPVTATDLSVTEDTGTTSLKTIVTHNNGVYSITGGTTTKNNGGVVFHSFGQFGLKTGEIATFNTDSGVNNILARVTGGGLSVIEGTLNSPTAGLWFMNSNGIVIGDGAQLNINGDLALLTADHILFDENKKFSALHGGVPDNIAVESPSGFGFLGEKPISDLPPDISLSGTILINQSGLAPSEIIRSKNELDRNKILISGRNISMQSGEMVRVNDFLLIAALNEDRDITIKDRNLSQLRPRDIYNKIDYSIELGDENSPQDNVENDFAKFGIIDVNKFSLESLSRSGKSGSYADKEVLFVIGNSVKLSNINFESNYNDRTIFESYGSTVELVNTNISSHSFVTAATYLCRLYGHKHLKLENFRYEDRSAEDLATDAFFASSDKLDIENSLISVQSGEKWNSMNSYLIFKTDFAPTEEDAAVQTPTSGIFLKNSTAEIITSSFVNQDELASGKLSFSTYGQMKIEGRFQNKWPYVRPIPYSISTGVSLQASSSAEDSRGIGSIVIKAKDLTLSDSSVSKLGALIGADRSLSTAQGGSIDLSLKGKLEISGESSGIFMRSGARDIEAKISNGSNAIDKSIGALTIKANEMVLNDSAAISSDALGFGAAGNLSIDAQAITLNDDSRITSSSLAEGAAGKIKITGNGLQLNGGASIAAISTKNGLAGTIDIDAENVEIYAGKGEPSSPISKTLEESGNNFKAGVYSNATGSKTPGSVSITGRQVILLDGSVIDSSLSGSASNSNEGSITLNSPNIQLKNGALITSESTSTADAGDITLNAQNSIQLSNSQITTNAPNANGGNIAIQNGNATTNSRLLQLNNSTISASAGTNGGNITIAADTIINIASTVKATGERGTNGDVVFTSPHLDVSTLITDLSVPVLDASRLLQQTCSAASARKASSFVVNKKPLNLAPGGYRLSRLNHAALTVADTKNSLPAKALKLPSNSIDCQSIAGI